jgi:hypothetical protein
VPLFNADGTVREWLGACSDITEQIRAEEGLKSTWRNATGAADWRIPPPPEAPRPAGRRHNS